MLVSIDLPGFHPWSFFAVGRTLADLKKSPPLTLV
jgi:hypothetical protein